MSDTITVSSDQRDLLYDRIMIHLSGMDGVWEAADDQNFRAADQLGRQVCDGLYLILEDLGWGETRGDQPVELTSPPDVVRRVARFYSDLARVEDAAEQKEREGMKAATEKTRAVRELCDGLLTALDGPSAASGASGDG